MTEAIQTHKMKDEEKVKTHNEVHEVKSDVVKEKAEKKSVETKAKSKPKTKKYRAVVNARDLAVSTKYAAAICKFVKGKRVEIAISEMEAVLKLKKAVPMKGEISHRKGKGMMSGKFPVSAAKVFITLLKSLESNANLHEISNPVITGGVANIAPRPYGKRGAVRKKRTHVTLIATELRENKKSEKKESKE